MRTGTGGGATSRLQVLKRHSCLRMLLQERMRCLGLIPAARSQLKALQLNPSIHLLSLFILQSGVKAGHALDKSPVYRRDICIYFICTAPRHHKVITGHFTCQAGLDRALKMPNVPTEATAARENCRLEGRNLKRDPDFN